MKNQRFISLALREGKSLKGRFLKKAVNPKDSNLEKEREGVGSKREKYVGLVLFFL